MNRFRCSMAVEQMNECHFKKKMNIRGNWYWVKNDWFNLEILMNERKLKWQKNRLISVKDFSSIVCLSIIRTPFPWCDQLKDRNS